MKKFLSKYLVTYQTNEGQKFRVRLPDGHGGHIRKQGFETIEAALKFAEDAYVKFTRNKGLKVGAELSVSDYCKEWLLDKERGVPRKLRLATLRKYQDEIALHILPTLGHLKASEVNAQDVRALDRFLDLHKKLASDTRRGILSRLKDILHKPYEDGVLEHRVLSSIRLPQRLSREIEFLEPKEFSLFLHEAQKSSHFPIIGLALYTGMRASEIAALRWDRVSLYERPQGYSYGVIEVALSRCQKTGMLNPPKNGESRMMPVLKDAYKILIGVPRSSIFVFGKGMEPLDRRVQSHFARIVRGICKKAGVRSVSFHGLRHSYISYMENLGVPRRVVAGIVGHRNLGTTDRYSHATVTMLQDGLNSALLRVSNGATVLSFQPQDDKITTTSFAEDL